MYGCSGGIQFVSNTKLNLYNDNKNQTNLHNKTLARLLK